MVGSAMPLREIMIEDVKTIDTSSTIHEAAEKMANAGIGSLIVIEDGKNDGKLLGILTERDILKKVVAEDLTPSEVAVEDIMAFPLISMSPDATVRLAIEKMAKLGIRRMPVVEGGELIGIVCDRDVFREAPLLMNISRKHREEDFLPDDYMDVSVSGRCADCMTFSHDLTEVDGQLLCPNCRMIY